MLDLIYCEESLKRQMIELGHRFMIVTELSKPIGFTAYELNYNATSALMIHKLYLLPKVQGMGVGSKVIHFYTQLALENFGTHIQLKVFFRNSKAIEFYINNGFYITGEETTTLPNGFPILDFIMKKTLK